jgi:hypothetical protein
MSKYKTRGAAKIVAGDSTRRFAQSGAAADVGELLMVGDIKESVLTEAQFKSLLSPAEQLKWAIADGRDVTGSAYAALTGQSKIPDLRGTFLRMAGRNNTHAGWDGGTLNGYQDDNTARPKNAFSGFTSNNGGHHHDTAIQRTNAVSGNINSTNLAGGDGGNAHIDHWTRDAGTHNHSVTITAGGDTETRPKSFSVNYFIKIN